MAVAVQRTEQLAFLWLELTGKCQLECRHCYASSGPSGTHGTMTKGDWTQVLDQAVELGGRHVQFIGGEPTLRPDLPELVWHALSLGLGVEVFSNLARRLPEPLWEVFEQPGVRLATSYYAADAASHDGITTRSGSHRQTRANIAEARRRGISIRAGVVAMSEDQHVAAAVADLENLGVTHIAVDRLRQVGRGVRHETPGVDQLCGHCPEGKPAVSPTGDVWPCPFARWLIIGNVHEASLVNLQERAMPLRASLSQQFERAGTRPTRRCSPDDGDPCGGPLCNPHLKCGPDDKK